ncbi:MAG: hypothetical protein NVV73_10510 [Cellvibrionaceae bacterium]|nr:hypothetical protein [Cellvibrionaceae bacterium]
MITIPTSAKVVEAIDDAAYQSLDKRGNQEPVPFNLEHYLTPLQLQSLDHLKDFGWQLAFVRRPLFEQSTVVLLSPEGKQYATLEQEGSLNLEPEQRWRVLQ